jgi:glycosyltransferase involved in cell wall biosynthesis
MRLLINAVGLRAGGGLTVGLNCLRGIREVRPEYELLALVPAGCGYEQACAALSIPYRAFARTTVYPAWRLWFDQVRVPLIARRWSADVLFAMNNQAAVAATCPQVLLFQNPYYIYPPAQWSPLLTRFERLSLRLQRSLFSIAARRCRCVAVQTDVAARRVHEQHGIPLDRIEIVPNAVAPEHQSAETDAGRQLAGRMHDAAAGRITVLTLARYYPHKELEFILRVARRLRQAGDRRFVFFITVAAEQHDGARALLATIERENLGGDVVNLGAIGYGELRSVYQATHACFLPTALESMSGTYLEALHYQLPIITADRDFAREVCGLAAEYFSPGDADGAIRQLHRVAGSPTLRHDGPGAPPRRGWDEVGVELAAIFESARNARKGAPEMRGASPSTDAAGSRS